MKIIEFEYQKTIGQYTYFAIKVERKKYLGLKKYTETIECFKENEKQCRNISNGDIMWSYGNAFEFLNIDNAVNAYLKQYMK